jgi:hypothetical protein
LIIKSKDTVVEWGKAPEYEIGMGVPITASQ